MDNVPHRQVSQAADGDVAVRMLRLISRILGNFLLIILLILIVVGSQDARVVLDIVFWFSTAGLVVIRYVDITVYHGHTADNGPATLKDWARYSVKLIATAGVFWVLAHAIITHVHSIAA